MVLPSLSSLCLPSDRSYFMEQNRGRGRKAKVKLKHKWPTRSITVRARQNREQRRRRQSPREGPHPAGCRPAGLSWHVPAPLRRTARRETGASGTARPRARSHPHRHRITLQTPHPTLRVTDPMQGCGKREIRRVREGVGARASERDRDRKHEEQKDHSCGEVNNLSVKGRLE